MAEDTRVLLFLSSIILIYVLAAGFVIRWLLHKFNLIAASDSRAQKWLGRSALTLAGIGVLCFAYGYLVEPYWLSVSHIKITSSKLPSGSRPIRIVHISDLHSDPKVRLEGRLPQAIAAERPDIIVFTGDSVNSPGGLPNFRGCLTELAKIAPTFVVKGNWDSWYWRGLNLFAGTGAHELDGDAAEVVINGVPIWIAGVGVGVGADDEKSMKQAVASVPPAAFKVFLYHYPDLIEEVAAQKVDLYCAGHTHGGQVALPLYGALVTLSKYGKRYEAGLYREDQTWLYVNRGIGMEGGSAPRVRFWARPEVTVIEVSPEER
jgi:predicted MPP superfamily phosphohydrolase